MYALLAVIVIGVLFSVSTVLGVIALVAFIVFGGLYGRQYRKK